jgi:hypothetical protein
MTPPIVCLMPVWRDHELALSAIRSVAPHVDLTIVLGDLEAPPYGVVPESVVFAPEPADLDERGRRSLLLELGRHRSDLFASGDVWALTLNSDEVLVHGELLRDELRHWPHVAWPVPIVEPDGRAWAAPSHAFRLDAEMTGCHWLVRVGGALWDLSHEPMLLRAGGFPHIYHRHHLRSAERQEARLAWHRELDPVDAGAYRRIVAAGEPIVRFLEELFPEVDGRRGLPGEVAAR